MGSAAVTSVLDFKTDVIDLGSLGKLRVRRPMLNPARLRRRLLHGMAHAFQTLATYTTVRGQEHIPARGPLLVLPNHVSNLDGILVLANYPRQMEMVGPGDFRMVTLKDWMLRAYGVTPIRRGFADVEGLKELVAHLKAGRDLLMFPTGGMWEKRRLEAKPGAAYLSQVTGAPILPVAVGGTYLMSEPAFRMQHPRFTVSFGEIMPAVPPSTNRQRREADLAAASREIEQRIYDLLEPRERALYERWAREVYHLRVEFARFGDADQAQVAYDGPPLPDMAALAEFVAKPNLFRPMWQNAGLQVEPFRESRFFAPVEVQMAARQLCEALSAGAFARYLPYRMGEEAAAQVLDALRALRTLAGWAMARGLQIRLTPVCVDPGPS